MSHTVTSSKELEWDKISITINHLSAYMSHTVTSSKELEWDKISITINHLSARNSCVSLTLTFSRDEKVEYHFTKKICKFIGLRL